MNTLTKVVLCYNINILLLLLLLHYMVFKGAENKDKQKVTAICGQITI